METLEIEGYSFQRLKYPRWEKLTNFPIYQHQAATIDAYDSGKNILLGTKTGSGKTAAALFPIIKNGHSAVFIYPTNALIKNQLSSIYKTLTNILDKKVFIRNESRIELGLKSTSLAEADICIHVINREALEGCSHKGELIQSILHDSVKQTIVLTNPDTLFAMLSLSYREHLNVVRALERYNTIVVDEFHMYHGVQLANIIYMLKFAEKLIPNSFQRKIFLSATSEDDLELLLEDTFNVKKPILIEGYEELGSYLTIQPIILKPYLLMDELPIGKVIEIIGEIKGNIKKLKKANANIEFVPCVIIVNSVIDAIHIEEEIIRLHSDLQVTPYHGLMNKSERKIKDSHIIVGTNAIEVGIDFQCSFLIFDAGDTSSFIQRFGRLGRHEIEGQIATAYSFMPKNVYEYLNNLKSKKLSRDEFEDIIRTHFNTFSSHSGFVQSDYGMIQANIFIKKLQKLLQKWGKINDKELIFIESCMDEVYKQFKIDDIRKARIERRLKYSWFKAYLNSVSFRSTLPSVLVYDKREECRNRIPIYETEVSTALAKGTPCLRLQNPEKIFYAIMNKFNPNRKVRMEEDLPMVLIDNYDYSYIITFTTVKNHMLYAPFICEESDLFVQRKKENHGMGALFNGHIGMFIRAEDYYLTDWRTKKFTSNDGRYIVFDGDVLLYLSIIDRADTIRLLREMSDKPQTTNANII